MKNKLKWLVNLSTLILCVCALAIGVYAAKQASLTASGQIGFNAHGCDVDVTTYIYGHSRNADTAPLTEAQKETLNTQIRGENTTLALNTLYFSDVTDDGSVPNIIIQMSFLNKSEFDVSVKVDLTNTTIGNSNVTIAQDKTDLILTKGGTAQTITFTLTLKTGVDTFTSNANLKLKIDFAKYVATNTRGYLQRATTANNYTGLEVGSVYVEMGSYNGKALKWYAFAYSSDGTDANMTTFGTKNNCLVNSLSEVQSGTYYFISEYVLGTSVFNEDSRGFEGEVEYNGSELQQAIIALQSSTTYNFSASEVFKNITERDLPSETYETDHTDDWIGTTSGVSGQILWPLSYNETDYGEWGLLQAHGASVIDSNCKTCTVGSTSYTTWWTRSPESAFAINIDSFCFSILNTGSRGYSAVDLTNGLRPAFKLEII